MANHTRLYEVAGGAKDVEAVYLVEAQSQSAAWKHVAKKHVGEVVLPTGKRIAELMHKGVKVEEAREVE